MNTVQPIRDKRDITKMKKALHGRDLLLFTIGINSALRISDLLSLRVGDVKDRDFITVVEQKTGKTKRFAVNKSIKNAIHELIAPDASADEHLFKSRNGVNKPITRVQAYRILNDAAKRAGILDKIGEIGTHTMRKTMAYHAYKAGTDIALLMNVLNHASQHETLRYIGIQQDDKDNVYLALNL